MRAIKPLALLLSASLLSGCAPLMASKMTAFSANLNRAISDHDDPATVAIALPTYLILIDALLEGSPDDEDLLCAAANLYAMYAGVFVEEPERAKRLTARALDYGFRAAVVRRVDASSLRNTEFERFQRILGSLERRDLDAFYALACAWFWWIRSQGEDWKAIGEMARVESILERVVVLDDSYQSGGPHLLLGVLATMLPENLGGDFQKGREHFERALTLSEGKNLMVKVLYARHYARMIFDERLHDQLLNEVIQSDPKVPGLTLINTLAQEEALKLLRTSDEWF